jgi:hypothetical protein
MRAYSRRLRQQCCVCAMVGLVLVDSLSWCVGELEGSCVGGLP